MKRILWIPAYLKVSGRKFIFLILYVDDVLLASNDLGLLMNVKRMLSQNFDMKDLGEANFVLGIEIHKDRDHKFLGLSLKPMLIVSWNDLG